MITGKRMAAALAEAEADVYALRRAMALLNGAGRAVKIKRLGGVLEEAIAVDGARRAKKKRAAPTGKFSARVRTWMALPARPPGKTTPGMPAGRGTGCALLSSSP